VLLVLDQFEQWLHAKRNQENTELVQALRQCDGDRVQCLALVRDDFWMAATRFMRDLEIRLVEGQNSSAVDLFTIRHAEKVLAAFGRAFDALPESSSAASQEQKRFLQQAVSGLAQDGKIICMRLALFAEMMKGKAWTPGTLREVGGTEGVGVTFLEETFSAATAPPEHRYHQKAARTVLKSLLPEAGTDIKGHMRSQQELREASGYASRPRDFDDLLRILDGEIRLLTPTDPEGKEDADPSTVQGGAKYYQLTHDYLVPSIRDWLTRKQKETRRGRTELLLADRASVWNARPENRHLPSLPQWARIQLLTRKKDWTEPQRKMMQRATRYQVWRGLVLAAVVTFMGWVGFEIHGRSRAEALGVLLAAAETPDVPLIVAQLEPYRHWANPLLTRMAEPDADPKVRLHASLALLPVDDGQVDFLYDRLLTAQPHEVPVLRDALAPHKEALLDRLWAAVEHPARGQEEQRLRAASALAGYDADNPRWANVQNAIANNLVGVQSVYLATWMEALRPVRGKLQAPLEVIYRNPNRRETERSLATDVLAEYAAEQPRVLAELLMDADDKQFAVLYSRLTAHGDRGMIPLQEAIDRRLPPDAGEDAKEQLGKRQANAAVALLRLNQAEKVWPLLKRSDQPEDPRLRSYLIHRLAPLGADAGAIVKRLDEEPDVTIRRALDLSLGEYKELSPETRKTLVPKLQTLYLSESDPGLHAAVEWLLRQWQEELWLKQINDAWAKDKEKRAKRLESIRQLLSRGNEKSPQWYINSQGQTMVVIPGPVEFVMGSPLTEADRRSDEGQHKKRISRTFALAAAPVTKEQYLKFQPGFSHEEFLRYPAPTCPIGGVTWYEAAAYCNWLSQQEGIPEDQWCYETKNGQVTQLKENYLSRTGYRLPTEAEMEYATRAGALTSRYYGETEELLPKYAWYVKNSQETTRPIGSLKPNDWGLFDTLGNVYTWCQESYKDHPLRSVESTEDKEDTYSINKLESRMLRGGSFFYYAYRVRCAYRGRNVPTLRALFHGFCPARTYR
jgi:formylglycine-generating enzyme required for sulfatase activity